MAVLTTIIIADDLTGALDSVAPFAAIGMDCVVATSPDHLPHAIATAPQVLSINLGSRELAPDQAGAIAATMARAVQHSAGPDTIWFKKIDSRMKGHIATEVAAVARVIGAANVLMCPAIPQLGRVVTGGFLRGEGVATPVPVFATLPVPINLATPDATTDDDLDRLVQANGTPPLFVGARGLAAALARRLRPGQSPAMAAMPHGPVGFCIGSRDPVTLAQVAALTRTTSLPCIAAPDGVVPQMQTGGAVLVQATQGAGASPEQVSQQLAKGMLPHLAGLTTLVITGGETAGTLLNAANIGLLRVMGEVQPGLPLCHAIGTPGFPALVTKSGGFGQSDTFLRLWQAAHRTEGYPCR